MSRLDTLHKARIIFADGTVGPATTLRKYAIQSRTLQEAIPIVGFAARYRVVRQGFVQLF